MNYQVEHLVDAAVRWAGEQTPANLEALKACALPVRVMRANTAGFELLRELVDVAQRADEPRQAMHTIKLRIAAYEAEFWPGRAT